MRSETVVGFRLGLAHLGQSTSLMLAYPLENLRVNCWLVMRGVGLSGMKGRGRWRGNTSHAFEHKGAQGSTINARPAYWENYLTCINQSCSPSLFHALVHLNPLLCEQLTKTHTTQVIKSPSHVTHPHCQGKQIHR